MGDGADYARECEEAAGYAEKRNIWMQRDGTLIDVKDMHDEHLNNARAMVERQITEARESISIQESVVEKAKSVIAHRARRLVSLGNKKQMLSDEVARRDKIRKNDFMFMRGLHRTAEIMTDLAMRRMARMKPTVVRVHVPKGTGRVRVEIVEDKE